MSNTTGKVLETGHLELLETFPRQLPKGVLVEDIETQAAASSNALKGMVFVQLAAQLFLKGSMNDLWGLFFTLQLICYTKIYDTPTPANAEIYMTQFINIIEF